MASRSPNGVRVRNLPQSHLKRSDVGSPLRQSMSGGGRNRNVRFLDAIGIASDMLRFALPALVSWGVLISLIFGGCCSNVLALEAIVKEEPGSGLLITFAQFIITFLFTLPSHFSASNGWWFLKVPAIPLVRWVPNILLFFTVNMLNNFAFDYKISVPVHIILRSGGSVTTILVGWIWGKRYTRMQVFSIAILTAGVIIAALSDAKSKGKTSSSASSTTITSFMTGLTILFVAQVLSAIMGLYTQATYAKYGPHWNENLFYSHFLSLPLFLPFLPSLRAQFQRLMASPKLEWTLPTFGPYQDQWTLLFNKLIPSALPMLKLSSPPAFKIPIHILALFLNSLTQYACIRGVNLLGARTSALGVTIMLNVRKLVSLFISMWLFGNELPLGVMLGAAAVFTGGGIYAWEGIRMQKSKRKVG